MVQFSNCKINLGLHIISKRSDGYHNLETCFYPVPYYDVLELIHANEFAFTSSGLTIRSHVKNNLCIKAYELLRSHYPQINNAALHLHKNIPMGAGVGGGSANAAYTLILYNKLFQLQITETDLIQYAGELGSDCPFFIKNTPCFASSRGEHLEEISLTLSGYDLALVFSDIHISTKDAFSNIVPQQPLHSIKTIIQQPIDLWKNFLVNDFEKTVFAKFPLLQNTKEQLYTQGAVYASMSGSGSTVYGIFKKDSITEEKLRSLFPKEGFKLIKL